MKTLKLTPTAQYLKRLATITQLGPKGQSAVVITGLTHSGELESEAYRLICCSIINGVQKFTMTKENSDNTVSINTIHLSQYPACSCTDHARNRHRNCKHLACVKAFADWMEPKEAPTPLRIHRAEAELV